MIVEAHAADWAAVAQLDPGMHVVLLGASYFTGFHARAAGLEIRDTIMSVTPNGVEAIFLCRKPLTATVAETVLKYGTSGLHIDAARIGTQDNLDGGAYSGTEVRRRSNYSGSDSQAEAPLTRLRKGIGQYQQPAGRWPPNLVFTHADSCKQTGTRKVRTDKATRKQKTSGIPGDSLCGSRTGELNAIQSPAYGDETGHETTAAWSCAAGCPVKALDELSGELTSGGGDKGSKILGTMGYGSNTSTWSHFYEPDSGAASRFFPQFRSRDELLAWLETLAG